MGAGLWLLALGACCSTTGLTQAGGSTSTGGSATAGGTTGSRSTNGTASRGGGVSSSGGLATGSSSGGPATGSSTGGTSTASSSSGTGSAGSTGGSGPGDVCPPDGGFSSPLFFAAGPEPALIGAADFEGNGHLDLAVANFQGGVSILPGAGNGTFGAPRSFVAQLQGLQGAVADWNGDGRPDLAVTDLYDVYMLLNDRDGGFLPAVGYTVAQASELPTDGLWVAAGDFNGDGALDVAFTQQFAQAPGMLSVLLNQGGGAFAAGFETQAGPAPANIAAADFNGDGKLDVAVVEEESWAVDVFLGAGDGTFSTSPITCPLAPPAATYAEGIAVADFDGDGRPDIAAGALNGPINILLNQGAGAFVAAGAYAVGTAPSFLTTADVNGDGSPDVVSVDQWGEIEVLFNDGSGSFPRHESYTVGTSAQAPVGVAAQDFNGDGRPDLATALQEGSQAVVLLSCPGGN
ncbi:MAG TPA: VCBS repeat-containing protein [Myxococcales bacterium]|nr:VCBS repeat-containing protein [Myxococcales bacterium]